MPRILATFIAVTALVVGVFVPVASVSAAPTATIGAAQGRDIKMSLDGFDPGNIISDAVFTNRNTMSEAQIQAFFNSKVSRCQGGSDKYGPIICLKDFTITSVNRPADRYCQGYTGAPNESAARIIYRVAQSCGINPQVLIVMLQKEQGLVTHTWPSMNRYNAALGQGCPDGGVACDPNYVGFFHQIYGAARQMQIYMEGRYFTYYAPGKTWNILYNPNRNCGSAPVYVSNMATSALYYYTPYQPNPAALRAGYGEGDGCSAYGNRNFYNYFTDWFGSTRTSYARILRDASTGATYILSGATKFSFPTAERAAQFTWVSPVETVSSAQLAGYADGGAAPRVVRTDLGYVYLLDGGRRLQVPSCAAAAEFGWNCSTLPIIAQVQISAYRDGGLLAPSVQGAGSTWLMQGAYKREIVDTSLLSQYGISSAVSAVADALVQEYWLGDPVLGAGVYADAAGRSIAVLQGGTFVVPPEAQVDAMRRASRAVTAESLARLSTTGTLPVAASVDGRSYILGNNGWTAVDAYGSAVTFVALPSGAMSALPQSAAVLGPHFVRERSSLQVYLISGGALQPVTGEQQRQITGWYGVSPTVQVVADSALGKASTGKGLVRTSDGAAFLIDGTNRYRFLNCGQVADWGGDCAQLTTVTASQLAQTVDRGWLNYLVRHSDGTSWLVQSGTRREVVDASVLAAYGISPVATPLSGSILEPLALGIPVLAAGAYSDGSSGLILVNPAGTFSISPENRLAVVTNGARKLTPKSFALLPPQAALPARMISDGRALMLTDQGWLPVDPAQYGGTQLFTQAASSAWLGVPVLSGEMRPHFIREQSSTHLYLVSGGMLQPIADESSRAWMVAYYGVPAAVRQLPAGAMKGLPLSLGIIFRDTDSRALLSDGTAYYQFASCDAARAFGRSCDGAAELSSAQLGMKNGGVLAPLLKGSDGILWLVQGGIRREVPNPAVLAAYGIGSASTVVSDALIGSLPIGDPVVGFGTYRDSTGAVRLVTATGRVLDVPAGARVDVVTAYAKRLTDASFALLRPSGSMPVRGASDGTNYVLTTRGWLSVDKGNYGSLTFSATTSDVISALPSAGAALGPRFVREVSGSQVYLASGGLTPVTAEEQAVIARTYGVPSEVLVLADGALR